MTEEQVAACIGKGASPKPHKYGAKRLFRNGRQYDSTAEGDRHEELKLLEQAGEIAELEHHPKRIELCCADYTPDFRYVERGRVVFEDVKGAEDRVFNRNCRAWRKMGPGVLRVVKRSGRRGSFVVTKEIAGGKA
jgi:hypothetical protein